MCSQILFAELFFFAGFDIERRIPHRDRLRVLLECDAGISAIFVSVL
jgi:hypothetical protein